MKKVTTLTTLATVLAVQGAVASSPEQIRQLAPQIPHIYSPATELIIKPPVEPDVEIYTAGHHYFKRAVTSTKPQTTSSTRFTPLRGALTYIFLPAGRSAMVNTAFTAESRCNEPGSTAPDWCEVRIMVDRQEASPAASSFAPDTYAFDSTDGGTEGVSSWESHAMDRHKCVRNTTKRPRWVPIQVQWKVTNFDGGNAPNFWLDDWSLTVELAAGCRVHRANVHGL